MVKAKEFSKQDILDTALGQWHELGFTLKEPDDHVTELYFGDTLAATFHQTLLTFPMLDEACRNHLRAVICEHLR